MAKVLRSLVFLIAENSILGVAAHGIVQGIKPGNFLCSFNIRGVRNIIGNPGKPVVRMYVRPQIGGDEQTANREILVASCFLICHEWCIGRKGKGSVGEDGKLGQRRMPIDKTLSYGADLVKRYDRDRFLTGLFAPNGMREPLMVLYAFNVEIARIRETVTEPMIGQMRLQWWRDTLTDISQGKGAPKGHPVAEDLATLMVSRSLNLDHFLSLLDAREQDMTDEPPRRMEDLIAYCRGSSVGLAFLALDVLGVRDEQSRRASELVATAWALTGIARAVRHHALAGRVMLPTDGLEREGLAVQSLQSPDTAGPSAVLIREVCDQARTVLDEGRSFQRRIDFKALPVLVLATLADRYLAEMKTAEYQIYDPRLMRQRPAVARLWWNAWRKRY